MGYGYPFPVLRADSRRAGRPVLAAPTQWRHGYGIARNTGLKSGTLYPVLIRLADRGLVEARWEDDQPSSGREKAPVPAEISDRVEAAAAALVPALPPSPACTILGGVRTTGAARLLAAMLAMAELLVLQADRRDWVRAMRSGAGQVPNDRERCAWLVWRSAAASGAGVSTCGAAGPGTGSAFAVAAATAVWRAWPGQSGDAAVAINRARR